MWIYVWRRIDNILIWDERRKIKAKRNIWIIDRSLESYKLHLNRLFGISFVLMAVSSTFHRSFGHLVKQLPIFVDTCMIGLFKSFFITILKKEIQLPLSVWLKLCNNWTNLPVNYYIMRLGRQPLSKMIISTWNNSIEINIKLLFDMHWKIRFLYQLQPNFWWENLSIVAIIW